MAMTLGGGTGWVLSKGTPVNMANLDPLTWMGWIMPTTLTDTRIIFSKLNGTPAGSTLRVSGAGGNIEFIRSRATTDASFITNNTPIVTLNKWYCVAVTFASAGAAGEAVNIYVGDLTTPLTECTYGTATDGTGAIVSESSSTNYKLGNGAGSTLSFQGKIGPCMYHSGLLTLGQMKSWQWRPKMFAGTRALHFPGSNGTTNVPDLSGNGNTLAVTSATIFAEPPLGPYFGSDFTGHPVAASAPTTVFADIRADIIAGLTSAQSETHGWNADVKTALTSSLTSVVRTSDTVVTITLPAVSTYDITVPETITATVPASAVVSAAQVVALPTFDVTTTGTLITALQDRRRSIVAVG